MKLRALLSLAALGVSSLTWAWNDTGHMLVSAIAELNMTPKTRERVAQLVAMNADEKNNTVITCACWADDHKDQTSGPWHYINYHFNAEFAPTNNVPESENIVAALKRFTAEIKAGGVDDSKLADDVRFIIHFVGDAHQPLHCLARDTDFHPSGDRGGNDFAIDPITEWDKRPVANLHAFWDMGGGSFIRVKRPLNAESNNDLINRAKNLMKEYPKESMKGLDVKDPDIWTKESYAVRKEVYNLKEGDKVSETYMNWARNFSKKQVTLAGYRLADLLNSLFDPK